ncbi:MAG: polysaccharide deacetylase family protein [Chloroflexi bacterium]|nr:polysaccharide deacetylase family protein [Chloroflexota bacterium]
MTTRSYCGRVWSACLVALLILSAMLPGLSGTGLAQGATPTLVSVAVSPASVAPGGTLTLSFTVSSPSAQQVTLGAGIRPSGGGWIYDGANDRTVSVPAGTSTVTRPFAVPSNEGQGLHDVIFGLWSPGFGTQYGVMQRDGSVTVTPPAPPSTPTLVSVAVSPASVAPGGTLTLSFTVSSPSTQQVSLGAGIRPSGGGWIYDGANDRTVTVPAGTSTVTRPFTVPSNEGQGSHDVIFGLWSAGFGTQYGVMQRDGSVTVTTAQPTATPTATATRAATSTPTATSAPTTPALMSVAVSPSSVAAGGSLTLSFTVSSPSAQQVSLGAGIRPSGGGWIYDGAGDRTVSIPAGTSTVTRPFAVPVSESQGSHDVIFGLWSAGFGAQYGVMQRDGSVTVTAPQPTATPTAIATSTAAPTATATSTPTTPAIMSVAVSPASTAAGGTVTLSYTITSPSAQQVSLGAGIQPAGGCCWTYDPQNDATVSVPAGQSTVTRDFAISRTAGSGSYDVIFGLWSAGFATQYGSTQRNSALAVTPPQPSLVDVSLSSASAPAGSAVSFTFTVTSGTAQQVSLGAGLASAGSGAWFYDPAGDQTVTVGPGSTTVNRTFFVPMSTATGSYDAIWAIWSPGFDTQYGQQQRGGALSVTAPLPTPTGTVVAPTPTVAGTPGAPTPTPVPSGTPTGPTLLGVDVSPRSVNTGAVTTLSFTIYSPSAAQYGLGAQIGPAGQGLSITDPGNDRLVNVPAGTSTVTRPFYVEPDKDGGSYDVAFGLNDPAFQTQYGYRRMDGVLTVVKVAQTPVPGEPAPTATPRTVSNAAVYISQASPNGGAVVMTGTNVTVSYTVKNTSGGPVSVRLGASLAPTGNEIGAPVVDTAGATTVTVPSGGGTVSRQFAVPGTASEGGYDMTWTLTNPSSGATIDTFTLKSHIWLSSSAQSGYGGLSLTNATLDRTSITLQRGSINQVNGTFTIDNDSGAPRRVLLRMRIRRPNDADYIYDYMNDNQVTVPVGVTTLSRPFALPLYLPTGAHDVLWELWAAGYDSVIDNVVREHALQVNNPVRIPNVGVPILMYHNVNPTLAGANWVSLSNLAAQMDYLVNNGYTTVGANDVYAYVYKGTALPPKPVWVTFDDSYQNVFDYTYPILRDRGLRVSIFGVTQYMGYPSVWDLGNEPVHMHMTWNMLRTMLGTSTVFGDSHTQHHARLGESTTADQTQEIWGSQRDMAAFTGNPGAGFAYPYGSYTDVAEWSLAKSGFRAAVVIGQQKQHTDDARDMYQLTRIGIADSDTVTTFANKLNAP